VSPATQAEVLHVIVAPEQGSFQVPQTPDGQVVFGVQQVAWSAFEHCSPLVQFEVQLTNSPVHGSVKVPQKLAGQVVFGVQQVLKSDPPSAVLHWVPAPHGALAQVSVWPVHGSVQVAPHQLAGQVVAGVQQVALSALEQTSGATQFVVQSSVAFVHGS
jgi:hypothetical protein